MSESETEFFKSFVLGSTPALRARDVNQKSFYHMEYKLTLINS